MTHFNFASSTDRAKASCRKLVEELNESIIKEGLVYGMSLFPVEWHRDREFRPPYGPNKKLIIHPPNPLGRVEEGNCEFVARIKWDRPNRRTGEKETTGSPSIPVRVRRLSSVKGHLVSLLSRYAGTGLNHPERSNFRVELNFIAGFLGF